jgi:imidazolonepropionase-like amidohydrolase
MLALALVFAAGGVWLSTSPRAYDAGQDSTGVHVDGITLTRAAQSTARSEVFTGAATMVIDNASSGVVTAAAVMTWNGVSATGRCVLRRIAAEAVETCAYELGSNRVTSTDSFSARTRTWYRVYSDGLAVNITVPRRSAAIPIPFPLGR